ncbi:hypothetical protein A4R26_24065 [Niastella populi]|uniref:Uncharacterized protein n=2 Tax=Niastella populi TaxID=550983 RepID=A0A1V9FGX9_9BACT|nr:hypothetical protein A4R26_24065 [Niastella populi]
MKYGLNIFGQDINPLSLLISQVKTHYYSAEELENAEERILNVIKGDRSKKTEVKFPNIDKWFTKEAQTDLSKIYRAILKEKEVNIRKFFWTTLAEVIRLNSNDRTSTFKLHMRPLEEIRKRKIACIKSFETISKRSIKSLTTFCEVLKQNGFIKNGKYSKSLEIAWADTKKEIKTKRTFNLLITSPPYGDNQSTVTYGQFSYLPLQWIPLEDIDESITFDYLRSTLAIDTESLGGTTNKSQKEMDEIVYNKSKTLKKFINQFEGVERRRADKITRFIYDLDSSINNMLPKLSKDSYMVWTIGNRNVNKKEVKNDIILSELMDSNGISLFTDLERDILSKRMPGKNNISNTMSKEKILIFKKSS